MESVNFGFLFSQLSLLLAFRILSELLGVGGVMVGVGYLHISFLLLEIVLQHSSHSSNFEGLLGVELVLSSIHLFLGIVLSHLLVQPQFLLVLEI